jgi:hypothetical protein
MPNIFWTGPLKEVHLAAYVDAGEYPIFVVHDRGEMFDVDCRDGVHITARSGLPGAVTKAADVARELSAIIREHGERDVTEFHQFETDSLGSVIASEIRQAAYERISVPVSVD